MRVHYLERATADAAERRREMQAPPPGGGNGGGRMGMGMDRTQTPQAFPLETCTHGLATGVNLNQQLELVGNLLTSIKTNTNLHYQQLGTSNEISSEWITYIIWMYTFLISYYTFFNKKWWKWLWNNQNISHSNNQLNPETKQTKAGELSSTGTMAQRHWTSPGYVHQ